MTLLYPFLIFVLGLGISQADESCTPFEICREKFPPYTDGVPENAEGFEKLCEFLVPLADCLQTELEKCDPQSDPQREFKMIVKGHPLIMRVCNPDTLLNKALRENVECIHSNAGHLHSCSRLSFFDEEVSQDYIESLSQNGVTLTEEERGNNCLIELTVGSCFVTRAGELCGEIVKDAVMEIVQGGVNALTKCSEETLEKLSTVVSTLGPRMSTLPDTSSKK